jgi:hypothetical protein
LTATTSNSQPRRRRCFTLWRYRRHNVSRRRPGRGPWHVVAVDHRPRTPLRTENGRPSRPPGFCNTLIAATA